MRRTTIKEPVSILMPVCNEIDVIEYVVREWMTDVIQYLPPQSELVLDDCSTDGTSELIMTLQKEFPQIRLNRAKKDGFFNSAIRLYRLARCPLVFFTDSDGQYIPSEFWKIADEIANFDMVHGAKINRKDPPYRLIASRCFNVIVRFIFASKCEDVNSAFRLIRRPLLNSV